VTRRLLAGVALAAGLLAAVSAGVRREPPPDAARLASAVAHEEDHVTALELAQWIRDRKPGLRILDLRTPAEFATLHLPRAERVSIEQVVTMRFGPDETLVLISDGGAHAAQAWVLLEALGHRNVYFLRGGLGEWIDEVLNPAKPSDLTRYFGGMPRGDGAAADAASIRRRGC
jgi:rhodanese-related sulfurtransferase